MIKISKVILCGALSTSMMTLANDDINAEIVSASTPASQNTQQKHSTLETLKGIQLEQLKVDAKANQPENIKDPLQPLNRKVYSFNTTLDQNIVRPLALQYQEKIPTDVRGSYGNFRSNLREPWNAVNQLLQGKPSTALKSLGRFTVNTATSLGFADTAKHINLINNKEDFGTTLGVWGVKSGPYIMLPILGPSTLRDSTGLIADSFARPQSYIFENDKIYWTHNIAEGVDTRAQFLAVDSIVQGDQYAALRDVYLQQRAFTIASKRGENASDGMFMDDSFHDDEFIDEDIPEGE